MYGETIDKETVKDETMRLLTKYRQHPSVALEGAIIALNQPLITYVVKRSKPYFLEFEDAFQEASIGMLKAIRTFDPTYRCQFTTFAVPVMINALYHAARRMRKWMRLRPMSLDLPLYSNEKQTRRIVDTVAADPDDLSYSEITDLVASIAEDFSERDRNAILLYCRGYNQHDVSLHVGISQPQVCRVLKRFKTKLHEEIAI